MDARQETSGLRFLENLAYLVPGYRGYKCRDRRQEEDSRLRARVCEELLGMIEFLDQIRQRWAVENSNAAAEELGRRRLRLQTIVDAVRYAPYGFRDFFHHEILEEHVLEQVLETDLLILEDLSAAQGHLVQRGRTLTCAPRTTRAFFRHLDERLARLESHLIMREKILASA